MGLHPSYIPASLLRIRSRLSETALEEIDPAELCNWKVDSDAKGFGQVSVQTERWHIATLGKYPSSQENKARLMGDYLQVFGWLQNEIERYGEGDLIR